MIWLTLARLLARPAVTDWIIRPAGTTATLGRGEFHRVAQVVDGGAWTLFVTWGARRGWSFKRAPGSFVSHEEY